MEFIALPVKKGDSFILKNEGKNYVIDGGFSETSIVQMVKTELGNQGIEILVCTHYDEDHLNGVIGLINSDIDINEIWLPSIFVRAFRGGDKYSHLFEDELDYEEEIDEELLTETGEYASEEEIDGVLVSLGKKIKTVSMRKRYMKLVHCKILPRIERLLVACMKRKGISTIRWFKYIHWHTETMINNFPLIGLNCEKVKVIRPYKSKEELVLDYLTLINRMGLVFKYEKQGFPDVLFTSDSNFVFTGRRGTNQVFLKDESIVTAPHHGSMENQNVYSKVTGKNLIYVRSDEKTTLRPCLAYKTLSVKYCTICKNSSGHKEVRMKYKKGTWNTINDPCSCAN
ncbi:MBL fold metallo-hydrolase [Bacillus mycoides]|uniref:MBL fold metallo-hydrolase n=1 Tax=Bacillus mycoides TaxID=1405 RepID=UPI003F752012